MIGRTREKEILQRAYESKKPELVAIIGRRRVGKTYLIRSHFKGKVDFEMVGLKDGNKEEQLTNFTLRLNAVNKTNPLEEVPSDWLNAFHLLTEYLDSLKQPKRKKIVFIDELPWVASAKSGFLTGFGYFWNSYASQSNILVVICGSAAAWMIKYIINNKGGLHNRVTQRIFLDPFSLEETVAYFQYRRIKFDRYQILQLYMTMGGIPLYLDQVRAGKSATQNIDEICFHPKGLLRQEFQNLYSSLFTHHERHENIVHALSSKWKGLSRNEILKVTGLKDGGGLTTILKELEQSGFISSYVPFQKKKKDTLYRLTDNYSLFYLKFIKDIPLNEHGDWKTLSQTQSWKSWSGYAFENICLLHIDKIKIALGISGVYTKQSSFITKATSEYKGAQIDLLIDRADDVVSLCEIKYYNDAFTLTKQYAQRLKDKRSIFREASKTRKQIFMVLITVFGLKQNRYSLGLIDNVLDVNSLF